MKTLLLIGMGPGGPEYLTLQAIDAIRRVDVFFMLEKEGRGKDELLQLRRAILSRCLGDKDYRVVTTTSPPRRRADEDYQEVVQVWHDEKRLIFERLIAEDLGDGQCGALLLWGDPSIYDQTVSLAADLAERSAGGLALEIVPGISSVQVLAARHKIPLNRVGESILVTTGRHAETCDPAEIGNAVVMLDSNASFQRFRGQDMDLYWGAYLGCPDETLVSGPIDEVTDVLLETRARLRAEKGWIMDTYLLRRRGGSE
jgi:precorrin-6A synthase